MNLDERMALVEEIEAALGGGPAVAVVTVTDAGGQDGLALGAKLLVRADGSTLGALGSDALDEALQAVGETALSARPRVEAETIYASADGTTVERRSQARPGDARLLLEVFEAPGKLLVVGGGHVGLALATIGDTLGFQVTVVDDREEFATPERFPMAHEVHAGDIAELLDGLAIDELTSVVMVSRGHQLDELALRHTMSRGAAYVGMIGSRRRTGTVLQHLADDGFARADLEAVRTPIGLDIGAETPEEIALAILAEIVMVRRGGSAREMRDVKGRASLKAPPRA